MNTNDEKELSAKQVQAAILLAAGRSNRSVARELKVSEQTVCNWKRLAAFRALVDQHRARNAADLSTALSGLLPLAIEGFRASLTDASPALRLRAAQSIVASLTKLGAPLPEAWEEEGVDEESPKSPFDL